MNKSSVVKSLPGMKVASTHQQHTYMDVLRVHVLKIIKIMTIWWPDQTDSNTDKGNL